MNPIDKTRRPNVWQNQIRPGLCCEEWSLYPTGNSDLSEICFLSNLHPYSNLGIEPSHSRFEESIADRSAISFIGNKFKQDLFKIIIKLTKL